jgi:hypothetical protein
MTPAEAKKTLQWSPPQPVENMGAVREVCFVNPPPSFWMAYRGNEAAFDREGIMPHRVPGSSTWLLAWFKGQPSSRASKTPPEPIVRFHGPPPAKHQTTATPPANSQADKKENERRRRVATMLEDSAGIDMDEFVARKPESFVVPFRHAARFLEFCKGREDFSILSLAPDPAAGRYDVKLWWRRPVTADML